MGGNLFAQRGFQIVWMPGEYGIPAILEIPNSSTMQACPVAASTRVGSCQSHLKKGGLLSVALEEL